MTILSNFARVSFHYLCNLLDSEKLAWPLISLKTGLLHQIFNGIPGKNTKKLQYLQKSATRILLGVYKYEPTTPCYTHCPTGSMAVLLTHKCISGQASPYLQELITPQSVLRVPSISFALWEILEHPPHPAEGETALFF